MRNISRMLLVSALVLAVWSPAFAQSEVKADVAGSYVFLRDGFSDGINLPAGWMAAVGGR